VRELRADEVEWIAGIAEGYVRRAQRFKTELRPQPLPNGLKA